MRVDEVVTAHASCAYCQWRAQHRGPALEVTVFLRALLVEHIRVRHEGVDLHEAGILIDASAIAGDR